MYFNAFLTVNNNQYICTYIYIYTHAFKEIMWDMRFFHFGD